MRMRGTDPDLILFLPGYKIVITQISCLIVKGQMVHIQKRIIRQFLNGLDLRFHIIPFNAKEKTAW